MGHTQTGPGDEAGDQLLTRAEVAQLTRVSGETLRRWSERGIGPTPIRLGPRAVRYRQTAVLAWLDELTQQPGRWRSHVPAPVIPPACGECEARPDDHPSARWRIGEAGQMVKCPACHPGALVAAP